jgi:hypothetical protein
LIVSTRRKLTLARIISSEKVNQDGRDEDGLSTHQRIGTDVTEEWLARESVLSIGGGWVQLSLIRVVINDSSNVFNGLAEDSKEDFRGGVKA